jgi:sterol desaturase/sphingolipid hydroxylase (fatty acid hydroxylase superfamily)
MSYERDRVMIENRSRPEPVRLFKSDALERLTAISPKAFALTWSVVLALVCGVGWGTAGVAASTGLMLCGVLLWTLFEYGMHRFVFHLKAKSQFGQRLVFLTHGNHHVTPNDPDRNLMPPIVSFAIMGSFWILFVLVLGRPGSMLFLGFAIGYVVYDSIHYACHQLPMKRPVLRALRRHHMRHHYARDEGNFAITAIFWDKILGSRVPVKRR